MRALKKNPSRESSRGLFLVLIRFNVLILARLKAGLARGCQGGPAVRSLAWLGFFFVVDGSRRLEAWGHRSGSDPYPGAMTGASAATGLNQRSPCSTEQPCESDCTRRPLG